MVLKDTQYHVGELQKRAAPYGILDIASDNNIKTLQIYETVEILRSFKSRMGNDAYDPAGNEYELKTLDVDGKYIRTSHGLTVDIIERYRGAHWLVGRFDSNKLIELYYCCPKEFEDFFQKCETKLNETKKDSLNDPPITFKTIQTYGTLIFTVDSTLLKRQEKPSVLLTRLVDHHKGCLKQVKKSINETESTLPL
jgi:Restriction endonuclease PvuII